MTFLNMTDSMGIILGRATEFTTGSMFVTLFIFMIICLAVCILLQIPMEFSAILILPLVLGCMAQYTEFIATGAILIIYLSILITKNFILK